MLYRSAERLDLVLHLASDSPLVHTTDDRAHPLPATAK